MPSLICEIPVLPRIRKYLRVHYPGRIEVAVHDPLLAQLWAMFQVDKTTIREKTALAVAPADRIIVSIAQYHPSRNLTKQPLNVREIRMLNVLLDAYIYGEFTTTARRFAQTGGTALMAARQFCDKYDFSEEDLQEETLKRAWHRRQAGQAGGLIGFNDDQFNRMFLC